MSSTPVPSSPSEGLPTGKLQVITKKGKPESGRQSGWHSLPEQCVLRRYRTQSVQAENLDFILKAVGSHGSFVSGGDSWSEHHFRKLSLVPGWRADGAVLSAQSQGSCDIDTRASRHCLNSEPLLPCLNTSLAPQMLLLRISGTLKTLPPPVGARGPASDLILALPPACWVTLGWFPPCQPLKRG